MSSSPVHQQNHYANRFTAIRCRVNRAGNSGYSPLNSRSNFRDWPPNEMAPLFPSCGFKHWLIVMDKSGGEGATKQQMIDCYIQKLSKVVGRERVAAWFVRAGQAIRDGGSRVGFESLWVFDEVVVLV
ncbi:hypothetical protein SADUNF_Sadunf05G0112000 [Salix dunnii]|uniref:MORF/ORRM1/DAG-like MORF domain-containing protein n=1 Tax=Salix dunnii TaxID=1413687 RepID=A0A835K809_9ROSI|nr:hypothetical protein SADUNF_Sadunf05G0112000 [Salix dunnii]